MVETPKIRGMGVTRTSYFQYLLRGLQISNIIGIPDEHKIG